jgi:hypothetical protein
MVNLIQFDPIKLIDPIYHYPIKWRPLYLKFDALKSLRFRAVVVLVVLGVLVGLFDDVFIQAANGVLLIGKGDMFDNEILIIKTLIKLK